MAKNKSIVTTIIDNTQWALKVLWPLIVIMVVTAIMIRVQRYPDFLVQSIVLTAFVTFFGMVSFVILNKDTAGFAKAEFTDSLAITVIIVYIYVLALVFFSDDLRAATGEGTISDFVENFTKVVQSVIVFYFGSKIIDSATDSGNGDEK